MAELQIQNPEKRKDKTELVDRIFSLKSAIRFKLELEAQMELKSKLAASLKKSRFWLVLGAIFFKSVAERIIRRKIECSELNMNVEVLEKQRNIYHRNELAIEEVMESVYKDMEEHFDNYYEYLLHLRNTSSVKDCEIPFADVCALVDQHTNFPPTNKIDKLSFFIAMETTLSDKE